MCGQNRRHEMSAEEQAIRDDIAIKLESMFTHNGWTALVPILLSTVRNDNGCSASMHSIDEHYFPKETP